MKLSINPFLVLRIPAFAVDEDLTAVWEDLKVAISQSSPDFYDQIKSIRVEDLSNVEPKIQYTIWKYFNRARYRGTPYGSFAGFATTFLSDFDDPLIVEAKQNLHRFKDWDEVNIPFGAIETLFKPERQYIANSSIYYTNRTIRFLNLQDKTFELAEIEKNEFIVELLAKCHKRQTFTELLAFSVNKGIDEDEVKKLLHSLIELQLLFTDLNKNIIGEDYYSRINDLIRKSNKDYILAERKVISGSINKGKLRSLSQCIEFLISQERPVSNSGIDQFKINFLKRYEYQEMSLMAVLDPEIGIGYGEFESANEADGLVTELLGSFKETEQEVVYTHRLKNFILKSMLENEVDKSRMIQLKSLQSFKPDKKKQSFLPANTFTALIKLSGDLVILEQAGGVTANALSGRFTLASKTIESFCKDMARYEIVANPDVIFFDIAYMAEGRVDNINRRKQIYDYELPLLNYSCSDQLIMLDDLIVTVKGAEVILMSKKYRKRVVPRLASAYNFNRSDLPIYRFLCDLQHQNIQSQVLFDVQHLIPDLDYYPRIQYENIVISAAKWKISSISLRNTDLSLALKRMKVSRFFTVGEGDQTLYFDTESKVDLKSFSQYLLQQSDFMVTEAFVADKETIQDVYGSVYLAQLMVCLQHSANIYHAYEPGDYERSSIDQQMIVPGRDWLYFEIYCHPNRTDELLSKVLGPFISKFKPGFKCWYFIRYNHPSNQLRLRLQLKDIVKSHTYTSKLMKSLDSYINDGIVTDIQIKTYRRELQRYGHAQMNMIEQHFSIDSDYALLVADQDYHVNHCYYTCICLMRKVMYELQLDFPELIKFIKNIQDSFITEHRLESSEFKKINKAYSLFIDEITHNKSIRIGLEPLKRLNDSFQQILGRCQPNLKLTLFIDLFHMHINRIFSANQRTHEMVIYSFMYKILQTEYKNSERLVQFNT